MQGFLHDLPSFIVPGLTRGSLYALIALGYTLVYGVLQLINFAHSEVFMAGAFGSYLVLTALIGDRADLPMAGVIGVLILGLGSGAVVGAGVAWALERVAYRPLRRRGAPKLAFLISAIGASFFLSQLAGKLFNRLNNNNMPDYFSTKHRVIEFGSVYVTSIQLIIMVSAVLMMLFLDTLVSKTKLGRSIRSVAEDAPTAALMGVNIDKTISRTFVIGGALGGAAGFLFGTFTVFSNTMGFMPGVKAFAAAVLGGIGNIRGAMLGGLFIGVIEGILPAVPWFTGGNITLEWTDVVAFVVLVAVLIFRPTGILGEKLGRAA